MPYSHESYDLIYIIWLYGVACNLVPAVHATFFATMDDLISLLMMICNSYRTH